MKWLLQGEMCCLSRDAIAQTTVVTSGYLNSWCLLWSPTSLAIVTSDPRHQQGIFLLHNYHLVFCVAGDHSLENPGDVCVQKKKKKKIPGDEERMRLGQTGPGRSHCSHGSTRNLQKSELFALWKCQGWVRTYFPLSNQVKPGQVLSD